MATKQHKSDETAKKPEPVDAEHSKEGAPITKSRYWWAVLYPENMRDDWEDAVGDTVQVPYAYCIHSADTDGKSEHRKDHVHLILVFPNTTTYKHALNIFKLLGATSVNTCQAVVNIRHAYEYLVHNTETCRKQGKHRYDDSERITGNNFDIGAYEQVSQQLKNEMLREMIDFVVDNGICDITTFYISCQKLNDPLYFDVFKSYGSLIERICKGNHHRSGGR